MIKFTCVQSGKLYKPEHRVTGLVDEPKLLSLPLEDKKTETKLKKKKKSLIKSVNNKITPYQYKYLGS